MKVLLATANAHKIKEIREILAAYPLELHDLTHFPPITDPEETGQTYLENALLKARYYAKHTGLPAISDDSGLEVDALDGAPGLYSARFGGKELSHAGKISRLLQEIPHQAVRSARFRCCCAFFEPRSEQTLSCEETCEGSIASEPRGLDGFGYDPIFLVDGQRTMAELSAQDKHLISHRGKALRGLVERLLAM
jgi:XTP/dITP diphosphohydrolase